MRYLSTYQFRVWDDRREQMFYMGSWFNTLLVGSGPNWRQIDEWEQEDVIDEHLAVMQAIGLKDVNGKELYEGDIITYNLSAFVEDLGCVRWNQQETKFDLETSRFLDDCRDLPKKFTIVGNIYESDQYIWKE